MSKPCFLLVGVARSRKHEAKVGATWDFSPCEKGMAAVLEAGYKDAPSWLTFLWNLGWSRTAKVLTRLKGICSLKGLDRLSAISASEMCKKSRKTASVSSSVDDSFWEEARRVLCKANCVSQGCLWVSLGQEEGHVLPCQCLLLFYKYLLKWETGFLFWSAVRWF